MVYFTFPGALLRRLGPSTVIATRSCITSGATGGVVIRLLSV
jgi:hypothetical protein